MSIKQHREEAGMRQEDLAKRLGISRQAVVRWEKGLAYPTAAKLIKMADIFGCTTDELLGRSVKTK